MKLPAYPRSAKNAFIWYLILFISILITCWDTGEPGWRGVHPVTIPNSALFVTDHVVSSRSLRPRLAKHRMSIVVFPLRERFGFPEWNVVAQVLSPTCWAALAIRTSDCRLLRVIYTKLSYLHVVTVFIYSHYQGDMPDDGSSSIFETSVHLYRTAYQPRRQPTGYSPPWKHNSVFTGIFFNQAD